MTGPIQTVVRKTGVFLEMIKFEHSIFALPFAYLGLIMAEKGWPDAYLLLWVTVAMVSFRTMAMALNRLIDAKIDAANPRTKTRAIPAGKLRPAFVWLAALVSFAVFEWSAYLLGPLCLRLSVIPTLLAVLYPFTKRFTWFSHLLLGMILGIAPYGAWIASRGTFSWVPGMLTAGITAWVCGFDMIYAMQDEDFDRNYGLFSFPARFGSRVCLIVTRFLHLVTVACWMTAGALEGLGMIYFFGMAAVTVFLIREHWLIRSFGLKRMGEAFFSMNALVSIAVFVAVVIDYSLGS